MSQVDPEDEDPYMVGRNYVASCQCALFLPRLSLSLVLLHLLIRAQFGYLLHPKLVSSLPAGDHIEGLRIADVGTGTGYYILDLEFKMFDGFDISDLQYPPESWYGPNTTLAKVDIFKPLPVELMGKYDIVHLRFFMAIANDENVHVVIENLKGMLKPGGYLQWVERDWLSKFPKTASSSDDANTQLTAFMHKRFRNVSWIKNLPQKFEQSMLKVIAYEHQSPLPIYRKPWNEDHLIGNAAIGDTIQDEKEREWFKGIHERAATDCAKGWYVDWELIVCAAKKTG